MVMQNSRGFEKRDAEEERGQGGVRSEEEGGGGVRLEKEEDIEWKEGMGEERRDVREEDRARKERVSQMKT